MASFLSGRFSKSTNLRGPFGADLIRQLDDLGLIERRGDLLVRQKRTIVFIDGARFDEREERTLGRHVRHTADFHASMT